MDDNESPIRHVFVVGFHHKKGCQVEYCYPPLDATISTTRINDESLPPQWRNLSSLALPDGAHNFEKDTVFFHLPCNKNPNQTVYGVSCYRQISADKLKNKTEDVTRSTVQKSVCVISSLPLYGLLKAKLELITQAYFNQCDFDKVELLAEMYEHLKCSISKDLLQSQGLIGLSVRDLVLDFNNRVLILFKLLLLEKRVLFYGFPVYKLCHHILSLLSLFPRMIEYGLVESAFYVPKSSLLNSSRRATRSIEEEDSLNKNCENGVDVAQLTNIASGDEDSLLREIEDALNKKYNTTNFLNITVQDDLQTQQQQENQGKTAGDHSDTLTTASSVAGCAPVCVTVDNWGFPLSIFAKGSLCHPYLSLVYLDLLKSDKIRSYVFGATNALYKQRKDLVDVIVTIDDDGPRIDIIDPELRKILSLTTADLRFTDYVVKHVTQTGNVYVDNIAWEGGDEWIRLQFRAYLLSLMATAKSYASDVNKLEDFNESFVNTWMATHNYRVWACGHYVDAENAVAGTMQNSEQGRKLNQAVSQTGKYVSQTGKAVGGAVKSAVSNWWQGFGNEGQ